MDRHLLEFARRHRREPTRAESMIWAVLRNRQLGYKFRRQQPIGAFIVDFVCFEKKLIIELDGWTHSFDEASTYDRERQQWLERQGYSVVRFNDDEVAISRGDVVDAICALLESR